MVGVTAAGCQIMVSLCSWLSSRRRCDSHMCMLQSCLTAAAWGAACTADGNGITYNENVNVALAVSMPDGGLITPVIQARPADLPPSTVDLVNCKACHGSKWQTKATANNSELVVQCVGTGCPWPRMPFQLL